MTFHDDAVQFMQDLLVRLQQESQTAKSGTQVNQESADAVLLRILGVLINPSITSGGEQVQTEGNNSSQSAPDSLVHDFFKIQRGSTSEDLKQINRLLRAFRSRLKRYSKARTAIKLNRIKKLVEEPANPVESTKLVKDTPEDTRREVSKTLKKIQQEGDITGLLDQEIAAHTALTASVDRVATNIPPDVGPFRPQLVALLRGTAKESLRAVENLTSLKDALTKEANKLENMDKLLFEGQETFSNVKLSLLKVLDVLIFLTDRQQMSYNCSQCKFFLKGSTNACVFAGSGGTARTPAVAVPDERGNLVAGRLTQPTNSCKQVWGLESNEYYTPSDSIIKSLEKRLRGD